ncbi:hypothetical protein J1614_007057 [Plenodomus biglobosus]|nr:hypothetical protein J1614_007057 [Plenodomus biglobosus]
MQSINVRASDQLSIILSRTLTASNPPEVPDTKRQGLGNTDQQCTTLPSIPTCIRSNRSSFLTSLRLLGAAQSLACLDAAKPGERTWQGGSVHRDTLLIRSITRPVG